MKILVPQKYVTDIGVVPVSGSYNLSARDAAKNINPFCAIALEEAVRLRGRASVTEIVVVTVGDKDCQKLLSKSLACGADRAILVETTADDLLLPLDIACILQNLIAVENPDLILMGKQSVDYDNNQVGQMLSALLDWPLVNAASKLSLEDKIVTVEHEVDDGEQTHTFLLPGIVTVDLHINEPRSPGLADIVKARSKPVDTYSCSDFLSGQRQHLEVIDVYAPQRDIVIKMLDDVKDLAEIIKTHAYSQ